MRGPLKALVGLGLVLAAGAIVPAAVRAQGTDNSVAVMGGVYTFNEFQGDTDPVIGARWTSFLTPAAGVGLGFDWIPIGDGFTGLGYQAELELRVPTSGRVAPFFTLGAGAITFTGSGATNTYFAGILGAGVSAPVAEQVGLRFEARDRIYHVTGDLINDFHFNGGFEFYF